jgi:hypothetical protein
LMMIIFSGRFLLGRHWLSLKKKLMISEYYFCSNWFFIEKKTKNWDFENYYLNNYNDITCIIVVKCL